MVTVFDPLVLRGVTLKNRFGVSPMCMYSSENGHATDFHLVHLGSRAVGGYGLVFCEATAVTAAGRISPDDAGIWLDSQVEPLARITRFIKSQNAVPAIQLAHAGRKASTSRPFGHPKPHSPLSGEEGGWEIVGPSAMAFDAKHAVPRELTVADIEQLTRDFVEGAKRALAAEYEVIEIHAAHGYLLNSFLSPLSNKRTDKYGGSFANRARFLLEVVDALRKTIPESMPLFVRLSATDWLDDAGGWTVEDSAALAKLLNAAGVDVVDCSSGSNSPLSKPPFGPGFQIPLAARVKEGAGIRTAAVGMIDTPELAARTIAEGKADLILQARQALREPYFPRHAALALGKAEAVILPPQYGRA